MDAIELLLADHKEAEALFQQFSDTDNDQEELVIVKKLCKALKIHTQIEEEIFYPAARIALGEQEDLIDEAVREHKTAKTLIADIEGLDAGFRLTSEMKALQFAIEHHVEEEETEMFPLLRQRGMDFTTLGDQMAARKAELL